MLTTSYDTAFKNIPQDRGAMAVVGASGDTKYTWDPKNPHEVEAAKEHFERMRAKGFLVFKLKGWVKTEEVTDFNPKDKRLTYVPPKNELALEFDPDATRYVAVPLLVGG